LIAGLRTGSVAWPPDTRVVAGIVSLAAAPECMALLMALGAEGLDRRGAAAALELVLADRRQSRGLIPRPEIVWSGLEGIHAMTRDTRVVAQELFREAKERLDIASYSVDQGRKAGDIFGALAARMDAEPTLKVRMFLDVGRRHKDTTPAGILMTRFAERFRKDVWPGTRLPEVYFDRRSLDEDGAKRTCQHAKLIIVDRRRSLVTSANFSEAAHVRNVEAGLLVDDAHVAGVLVQQLDDLVRLGVFQGLKMSG
jgi:hypothetical protein